MLRDGNPFYFLTVPKLSYLGEHSEVRKARSLHACWTRMLYHDRLETIETSQSTNSAKTLKIFHVYSSVGLSKIVGAIHSTEIPTGPTGKSGPPQKVDPIFRNFSGWTEPIHWVLDRNFRKCWLNGSRPTALVSTYCFFCHSRSRCRRRPRCLSSLLKTMRIQNFGGQCENGEFRKIPL